jgi:anthranilate/para-aminobenzoate synthase component II
MVGNNTLDRGGGCTDIDCAGVPRCQDLGVARTRDHGETPSCANNGSGLVAELCSRPNLTVFERVNVARTTLEQRTRLAIKLIEGYPVIDPVRLQDGRHSCTQYHPHKHRRIALHL